MIACTVEGLQGGMRGDVSVRQHEALREGLVQYEEHILDQEGLQRVAQAQQKHH